MLQPSFMTLMSKWIVIALLIWEPRFADAAPQASSADKEWTWTAKELKEVEILERKVHKTGDSFELETDHWKVKSGISAHFTAGLARFMELLHAVVAPIIGTASVVPVKPAVLVYATPEEYSSKFPDGSRGYFKYSWNASGEWTEYTLYTFCKNESEHQFESFYHPILLHEGTHALVRNLLGKTEAPPWYDEGLATYFQFWNLRLTTKENLETRYSRSFYRKHLAEHCLSDGGKALSLSKLFEVRADAWNPDGMGPVATHNYAQAESLVDFFLSSDRFRPVFNKISTAVAKRVAANRLLSDEELRALERPWRDHVAKVAK